MRKSVVESIIMTLFLFISLYADCQLKVSHYLKTNSEIANPERGWYDDYYTYGSYLTGSYEALDSTTLKQNREQEKTTLILRMFYLHKFVDSTSVGEEYISKMQADFDAARKAGVKCIVRFAYSDATSEDIWDATPEKVLSHIESLRNVLADNADVIAVLQAGFIGVWGEWYYTTNFAQTGYQPDSQDIINRRAVVAKLLDILPEDIQVQVRTPAIKQYLTESDKPIADEQAYSGTTLSRIAHHNDCFLANSTDYGTYNNLDEDLAYMAQDTKYTVSGGETCDGSNSYSDCEASYERMTLLHWTFLNQGYNTDVYDKWEEQDCFDSINIKLGYRLSIDSAVITSKANQGDSISLKLYLENDGFAAPIHYKPISVVLKGSDGSIYSLDYIAKNDDVRFWSPGSVEVDGKIKILNKLDDDYYRVGILIKDKYSSLDTIPAYNIQFANLGTWDSLSGINWFNHYITIGDADSIILPETPTNLKAEINNNKVDLTWIDNAANESSYEIYRARNIYGDWELLQTLEANSVSYSDNDYDEKYSYLYTIRAITDSTQSEWSNVAPIEAQEVISSLASSEVKSKIFPNPLTGNSLTISLDNHTISSIIIYDIMGKTVFHHTYNSDEVHITNLDLKTGLYNVYIIMEDGATVEKLIVNH